MNRYKMVGTEADQKSQMMNADINKQNIENEYNYNLWRTGQSNKILADQGNVEGQVFGNMTQGQNQLAYYDALSKGYDKDLLNRNQLNPNKKRFGGVVKRSFKKK